MSYTVANDGQTVTVNGNTFVIAYLDTNGTTANRLARLRKSRTSTTGINNMDADGSIDATADVSGSNTNYATSDTVALASARTHVGGTYHWWANYTA
jgi:hypothetical protein